MAPITPEATLPLEVDGTAVMLGRVVVAIVALLQTVPETKMPLELAERPLSTDDTIEVPALLKVVLAVSLMPGIGGRAVILR